MIKEPTLPPRPPETPSFDPEHLETEEALNAYLRERHPNAPCIKQRTCGILDIESLLMGDLIAARRQERPVEDINRLRAFLRVSSWKNHARFAGSEEMKLLLEAVRKAADAKARAEHFRELRRHAVGQRNLAAIPSDVDSQKDADERLAEIGNELDLVERALGKPLLGDDAEPAALAMDDLIGSAIHESVQDRKFPAKKKPAVFRKPGAKTSQPLTYLDRLRVLRDQIYFQRLYPHLASKAA